MRISKGSRTIEIDGILIPCQIAINKKTKYIRLKVNSEGLIITFSKKLTDENIKKVIEEKKRWILNSYIKYREIKNNKRWREEKEIYYLGKSYPISISAHENQKVSIEFTGECFKIYVNNKMFSEHLSQEIEETLKKWFKEQARSIIEKKVGHFSRIIGVNYNKVFIKEQKTRWGSCSNKGNLNFNWKILMAEEKVIDYVVIHELCHLIHLNHSGDFWEEVSRHFLEYKAINKWLRENGKVLHL